MSHTSTEQVIAQLTAQYPGWNVWRSNDGDGPGELMATRRRVVTDTEMRAGLARTLPVGYHGDLRAQLAEQAEREDALGGDAS